jgi:flagellar protein FlbD
MIMLTRFNGSPLLINEDLIETCEETPDTVVSLQNGHKYFVKEKIGDILSLSIDFRRGCAGQALLTDEEKADIRSSVYAEAAANGGTQSC